MNLFSLQMLQSIISLLDRRRSFDDTRSFDRNHMPKVIRVDLSDNCSIGEAVSSAESCNSDGASSSEAVRNTVFKTCTVKGHVGVGTKVAKKLSSNGIFRGSVKKFKAKTFFIEVRVTKIMNFFSLSYISFDYFPSAPFNYSLQMAWSSR